MNELRRWIHRARALPLVLALTLPIVLRGVAEPSGASFMASTGNSGNAFAAAASFTTPTFRVVTYEIGSGEFTGTSYDLALRQDLAPDYFVMIRGAAGDGSSTTSRSPAQDYARVAGDPFGNLTTTTPPNVLRLERGTASSSWQGQITVVESMGDPTGSGFTLKDVLEITMPQNRASATATTSWTDISQIGLYGGIRGGGVSTTASQRSDHMTAWARVYPSGSGIVHLRRNAGGGGRLRGTTTFTIYVVEWGSQWTIQHVVVSGTAGGNGADQTSEYVTAPISPVARANTFIVAYGTASDNGLGDGWEGQTWTLGDGVAQQTIESNVAVGAEYPDSRTADVYVHTHASLTVDYRFGTDGGDPGIPSTSLSGTVAIDPAAGVETYANRANPRRTEGFRFGLIANTSNGTGTLYPRPIAWVRPTASGTMTWRRSRTGQPGAFWLQSVDFAMIEH